MIGAARLLGYRPLLWALLAVPALPMLVAALARRALAPLAFDPHGGGLSTYAAKAVALIDAGKLDEAGKAMQGQAAEAAEE